MKSFMNEDFLLTTPTAQALFNACKDTPIFDWHCHLQPKEIYENRQPRDITELWLGGDHYKWRGMRGCGINEKYITGDATPYEKFCAYAGALPQMPGNPLYHWTHLELQRYFGISEPLSANNAEKIWNEANAKIAAGGFTPRALIEKSNVTCVCTTDDPADTLEYHEKIAADKSFSCRVLPAFRPDKALGIEQPAFLPWLAALAKTAGTEIKTYAALKTALAGRIEAFAAHGCRATDHAFTWVPFVRATDETVESIFAKALAGEALTRDEADAYRTELFRFLAKEYARRNWGCEIHIGAMRNNNTPKFRTLGPDTGFDSIDDYAIAENLSRLLDSLETENALPRTILFTLNPKDTYVLGTMLGNFQSDEIGSKVQLGTAWWFNDNIDGMRAQLAALANLGVLGKFIGMVTDSRSFLSYPRHEYFRRILCEYLGMLVESGQYPAYTDTLPEMVRNISFYNAAAYFGI